MKKLCAMMFITVIVGVLSACGPAAPTSSSTEAGNPAAARTTAPARAQWEDKWNAVLADGKKEGKVSIYAIWTPQLKDALTQAFKAKYGIDLEFSSFGRGSDMLAKAQAEKRAGLNLVDFFGAGNPTLMVTVKPEGLLGPVRPYLILPEVLAPGAWQGGNVPFVDKEETGISLIALVQRSIAYNTQLVKEGEITSIKDLLKPQYKGKITINDPAMTGTTNALMAHLGHILWGDAAAEDYLRKLLKDQGTDVQRDLRIHMESVARGKYAIAVGPLQSILVEFLTAGAPVKIAPIEEDSLITAGAGAMALPTQLAHPNATTVFVNWLLTKEGMSVFSKNFGSPSSRIDVSNEGIDPMFIPAPGKKYYLETEDVLEARGKWLDLAKKIVEESSR